jgi:hypothetical protein
MAPKAIKPDIEGYAFYFFSNENNEPMHVHVPKGDGLVKYWLDTVALADDNGRMKVQEVRLFCPPNLPDTFMVVKP